LTSFPANHRINRHESIHSFKNEAASAADEELRCLIPQIVIMGGSPSGGNITSLAVAAILKPSLLRFEDYYGD
jgi:hypothetical protein